MKYSIIFESGLKPKPESHELLAAQIVAEFYQCEVLFLRRKINKTPDLKINREAWELKSPKGSSKRTIDNILRTASKQSSNIMIYLGRCKMSERSVISKVNHYLDFNPHRVRKIRIITKRRTVVDIYPKIDKIRTDKGV